MTTIIFCDKEIISKLLKSGDTSYLQVKPNRRDWVHRNFEHGLYSEDSPFGTCNICGWSPSLLEENALRYNQLLKIMGDHLEKEHGMKPQ